MAGRLAAGIAALLLLLAGPARSGELVENAATAEMQISGGRPVEALATVEAMFNSVWEAAPLGFSEALFVSGRPEGFGLYTARLKPVFAPGEPIEVYAEPFGYGFGTLADGFEIAFDADFQLLTDTGQILHAEDGFAELSMRSKRRNKEFQVFITYAFDGLRPGDYRLVTRLRDRHSAKTGQFELPFTLKSP